MRTRIVALVATLALVGLASTVEAEEPGQTGCEAWYEHYVALMSQIPAYADAVARMDDAQRARARERYLADCELVTADVDDRAYEDDRMVLECAGGAETLDAFMHCIDPEAAERERRQSEPYGSMLGIRTAERAYHAAFDEYVPCSPTPAEVPAGGEKVPFEGGGYRDFMQLGWEPDGATACRFGVVVDDRTMNFEITAECDLDGDGEVAIWKATLEDDPHPVTPEEVR